MTIFMAILFSLTSCKGQDKKEDVVTKQGDKKEMEQPKGTWKVDKEFDENGNFTGIKVEKGLKNPGEHEVDAISGATITSKGVENMINNVLKNYVNFFKNYKNN